MLTLYALNPEPHKVTLPDMSSLDAISHQLPQGFYSTFRTFSGRTRVLDFTHHLRRLYDPLAVIAVKPDVSANELRTTLRQLLKDFAPGEARVRISLSTDISNVGKVFVSIETMRFLDETVYQQGVRVILSGVKRKHPRLKTTSFIEKSDEERKSILQNGIFEALMTHKNQILEGLTSNFYAVKDRKIITARKGILLGVTRQAVLRLARQNKIDIEYRPVCVDELSMITEAFITSSSRGVVPVVEIDGRPVGQGNVGDIGRLLRIAYDDYVLKKAAVI